MMNYDIQHHFKQTIERAEQEQEKRRRKQAQTAMMLRDPSALQLGNRKVSFAEEPLSPSKRRLIINTKEFKVQRKAGV